MTKFSKKQGIQYATKKSTRGLDANKLDYIQMQFHNLNKIIHCIRNKIIQHNKFHTRNKCRETDLLLNNQIHLQHDSFEIHGELGSENQKTVERNADYLRAKIPYCIVNQATAKNCGELDEADLAEYLFYHEISKLNAMRFNEGK